MIQISRPTVRKSILSKTVIMFKMPFSFVQARPLLR